MISPQRQPDIRTASSIHRTDITPSKPAAESASPPISLFSLAKASQPDAQSANGTAGAGHEKTPDAKALEKLKALEAMFAAVEKMIGLLMDEMMQTLEQLAGEQGQLKTAATTPPAQSTVGNAGPSAPASPQTPPADQSGASKPPASPNKAFLQVLIALVMALFGQLQANNKTPTQSLPQAVQAV